MHTRGLPMGSHEMAKTGGAGVAWPYECFVVSVILGAATPSHTCLKVFNGRLGRVRRNLKTNLAGMYNFYNVGVCSRRFF